MSTQHHGHRTPEQERRHRMMMNIGLALIVLGALGGVAVTLITGR